MLQDNIMDHICTGQACHYPHESSHAGCATFGARTEGMHGPLTWKATDLRVQPTTAKDGEAYRFTLALSETEGSARTFTRLETRFQNSRGSRPVFWEQTGQ